MKKFKNLSDLDILYAAFPDVLERYLKYKDMYDKSDGKNSLLNDRFRRFSMNYDEVKSEIMRLEKKKENDSKKNMGFTRHGFPVKEIYKDNSGRNYAVIERPKGVFSSPDYLVGAGYDERTGEWAQGYYDFNSLIKARKKAKSLSNWGGK